MTRRAQPGRHNLPAETTRFVGRERETAELAALLPGERCVTLSGTGGIGKTRLARHVAARVACDFADGVWLVPLADVTDPELIPQAVAATVGVAEEPGRTPAETLLAALGPRELLLVLDNCEHLVEACAAFAERLLHGCPGLRVLATSREPLRLPGEVVWRVPPLDLPPVGVPAASATDVERIGRHAAIRLFADRAAAARPGFGLDPRNAQVVVRLARGLDGMPLALELAAARVAFLTVEQIADRLDERFRLLVQGSRTAAARQRTLRATVDWSHDLLGPDERVLLRRLAVFTGGWTLEAAEAVCADGAIDVLQVLGNLVAKSLVVPDVANGSPRYRLLETIRHYASERMVAADEAALLVARHRDHMVELAERAEHTGWRDPGATWGQRLDAFRATVAELDNLRAAMRAAVRAGDAESGLRLCTALRWIWMIQGRFSEGRSWFERCFALPARPRAPVRAAACQAFSEIVYEQGAMDLAAEHADEAREIFQRLGDRHGLNAATGMLARIDLRRGEELRAERRLEEVRHRARGDDPFNEAMALSALGALAVRRARLRTAARLHEESLAIFRRMEHYGIAATALVGLGVVAHGEGDFERAMRYYREAHATASHLDDFRMQRARCLAGIGAAALDLGELDLARRHLAESLVLTDRTGQRLGVARVLELFAQLEERSGEVFRAVRIAGASGAVREAAGVPPSPSSGARRERWLEGVRTKIGAPAVARLWSEGHAMSAETAIAYAVGDLTVDPDAPPRPSPPFSPSVPLPPPPSAPGSGPPPSSLTPREREVVVLICRGLTNREIAAELVISPGTAGRHVANILAKLGFGSRTQIAAWAAANSLPPEPTE